MTPVAYQRRATPAVGCQRGGGEEEGQDGERRPALHRGGLLKEERVLSNLTPLLECGTPYLDEGGGY